MIVLQIIAALLIGWGIGLILRWMFDKASDSICKHEEQLYKRSKEAHMDAHEAAIAALRDERK